MTLGSVTNYVGRLVDLLAYQGQQPSGDTLLLQTLVGPNNGGEICTGIVKLAQRWLLEFLTVQGALQYLPIRGCPFVAQVQSGQLRTAIDAGQAFYLAAYTVKQNLRAEESNSTPEDEAYGSVMLNSVSLGAGTLILNITLLSAAGEAAPLILPITVTNG